MSTFETPIPLSRTKSLFRRFSRRESGDCHAPPLPSPTMQSPPPRKLQRRSAVAQTGLPTPPDSPNSFIITNVQTQKQQHKQSKSVSHIQHVQLPLRPSAPRRNDSHHTPIQPSQRVCSTALPTSPFPGTPLIRPWNIFLPPPQVFALYLGFLPRSMSDKWFIYSEGPDPAGKLKVHFHRSWTGIKVAELFVVMDVKGEGAGKLVGIKWNGGSDTTSMTEEEAKYMVRTTCDWVLGLELEQG